MTAGTPPDSLALARRIADLVRERRATDVVLLDVRELVDYTDWFLICSGQSGRQNQAISEHVVKTLKADHKYAISKSGLETGSWVCLDLGDVVVHVFDPETRSRYDLELLWGDAPRVEIAALPTPTALPGAVTEAYDAPPAAEAETPEPDDAEPVAKKGPAKRKRVVRKAAVEEADADNAPDSERPPEGEPEPEATPAPAPAVRGKRASSAEALGIVKRAGAPKGRAAEPVAPASKPGGKGKLSPTPAASRAKASSLPARSKPKPSPGPTPAPKPAKASKPTPKPSKPAPRASSTPSKPAPKGPKPKKR